jgi:hypothetical protein
MYDEAFTQDPEPPRHQFRLARYALVVAAIYAAIEIVDLVVALAHWVVVVAAFVVIVAAIGRFAHAIKS